MEQLERLQKRPPPCCHAGACEAAEMFRNPRENNLVPTDDRVLPYVGRLPTPPSPSSKDSSYFTLPAQHAKEQAGHIARSKKAAMAKTPALGRQIGAKTPATKKTGNQSILRFFEKAETREEAAALATAAAPLFFKDIQQTSNGIKTDTEDTRFNEEETPVKRRRIDGDEFQKPFSRTPSPGVNDDEIKAFVEPTVEKATSDQVARPKKYNAGFLDESSDEEDNDWTAVINSAAANNRTEHHQVREVDKVDALDAIDLDVGPRTTAPAAEPLKSGLRIRRADRADEDRLGHSEISESNVPALNREATSVFEPGEFGDEDFENDEFFEGGEEFMERKWMEEQRDMGLGFEEDDSKSETESVRTPQSYAEDDSLGDTIGNPDVPSVCPICDGNMSGLSEAEASSHANACLDGNAEPLPKNSEVKATTLKRTLTDSKGLDATSIAPSKRFQRAAVARPAQSNPFAQNKDSKGGSAFARLMSGHAEDAAWAEAASNEVQSRGKPAYQRTCPFYKIMPGLFICVDAFRYGKVEGQNAYFLSHFHSDHYIGLTSSWCHGPIYASKVTCNLMIQQLRVDPKWVVPLEFEKKVEVPNTKGVCVTMIPANHCPGSSLYLFEKVTGKNRDGSARQTRILHCGDFRACPAHVAHPLLRPDVVDAITGQTRQQVIDTCYLDTTYLTPKYSFPSQYDVIDACAQMCVSLSKEIVDSSDGWEKAKAERAGSVMKKFLEQGEPETVKADTDEEANKKSKERGRLLVVIGTYSIGKERICLGIAKALNSKIYAPAAKMRICKCLEDDELNALLTKNPLEAQVHMTPLMEIRADTLHDYLVGYNGHFARVVGFRPTGWSYRPPTSRFTENPAVSTVLHSEAWKTRYTMRDLAPQRGSTRESNCFGVPYSEHSSFRELTMFCCALRINRIVPTVNVGSARSREKMKGWIDKWDAEKRKNGLFKVEVGGEGWGSGDGELRYGV